MAIIPKLFTNCSNQNNLRQIFLGADLDPPEAAWADLCTASAAPRCHIGARFPGLHLSGEFDEPHWENRWKFIQIHLDSSSFQKIGRFPFERY